MYIMSVLPILASPVVFGLRPTRTAYCAKPIMNRLLPPLIPCNMKEGTLHPYCILRGTDHECVLSAWASCSISGTLHPYSILCGAHYELAPHHVRFPVLFRAPSTRTAHCAMPVMNVFVPPWFYVLVKVRSTRIAYRVMFIMNLFLPQMISCIV